MRRLSPGKIIAISGGPRSGKSFLAALLAKHYGVKVFLEGEESDFPRRISDDIAKNIRSVELILWFHNKLVRQYLKALAHKAKGEIVILDTFWIDNQPYIEVLTRGFEKEILKNLASLNLSLLPWPDMVIFLDTSPRMMKKFLKLGGRSFDQTERFFESRALPVNAVYKKFFSQKDLKKRIIRVNRDSLDFTKKQDLLKIIRLIDNNLRLTLPRQRSD